MKDKNIDKIWDVWANENNISNPKSFEANLNVIEQVSSMFSSGDFYYYILNFETYEMEFVSPSILNVLGINPEEFSLDKLFEIMHPNDLSMMHAKEAKATSFLFNHISVEDIMKYKVVYMMQLQHKNGTYKKILHQVNALNISHNGRVQNVIGIHTDLTQMNPPLDHKISFISQTEPSYYCTVSDTSFSLIGEEFSSNFTKRELNIIKKISEGHSFTKIAKIMNLSPHTINTHKRNILNKSTCRNSAELIVKCIREGII